MVSTSKETLGAPLKVLLWVSRCNSSMTPKYNPLGDRKKLHLRN